MNKENLRFEDIIVGLSEIALGALGFLYVATEVLKVNPAMAGILFVSTIKIAVDGGRNLMAQ